MQRLPLAAARRVRLPQRYSLSFPTQTLPTLWPVVPVVHCPSSRDSQSARLACTAPAPTASAQPLAHVAALIHRGGAPSSGELADALRQASSAAPLPSTASDLVVTLSSAQERRLRLHDATLAAAVRTASATRHVQAIPLALSLSPSPSTALLAGAITACVQCGAAGAASDLLPLALDPPPSAAASTKLTGALCRLVADQAASRDLDAALSTVATVAAAPAMEPARQELPAALLRGLGRALSPARGGVRVAHSVRGAPPCSVPYIPVTWGGALAALDAACLVSLVEQATLTAGVPLTPGALEAALAVQRTLVRGAGAAGTASVWALLRLGGVRGARDPPSRTPVLTEDAAAAVAACWAAALPAGQTTAPAWLRASCKALQPALHQAGVPPSSTLAGKVAARLGEALPLVREHLHWLPLPDAAAPSRAKGGADSAAPAALSALHAEVCAGGAAGADLPSDRREGVLGILREACHPAHLHRPGHVRRAIAVLDALQPWRWPQWGHADSGGAAAVLALAAAALRHMKGKGWYLRLRGVLGRVFVEGGLRPLVPPPPAWHDLIAQQLFSPQGRPRHGRGRGAPPALVHIPDAAGTSIPSEGHPHVPEWLAHTLKSERGLLDFLPAAAGLWAVSVAACPPEAAPLLAKVLLHHTLPTTPLNACIMLHCEEAVVADVVAAAQSTAAAQGAAARSRLQAKRRGAAAEHLHSTPTGFTVSRLHNLPLVVVWPVAAQDSWTVLPQIMWEAMPGTRPPPPQHTAQQ